jgi:aminocarboxymuconate-semialdehyde decarboxylase
MFIHQGGATLVRQRADRYHLPNTVGNLVDRAVTFASFVFGGVMDQCPDVKVCLAHGGGYTCFGISCMNRGWQARSEDRPHIDQPPSTYLHKFYYDYDSCVTQLPSGLASRAPCIKG